MLQQDCPWDSLLMDGLVHGSVQRRPADGGARGPPHNTCAAPVCIVMSKRGKAQATPRKRTPHCAARNHVRESGALCPHRFIFGRPSTTPHPHHYHIPCRGSALFSRHGGGLVSSRPFSHPKASANGPHHPKYSTRLPKYMPYHVSYCKRLSASILAITASASSGLQPP